MLGAFIITYQLLKIYATYIFTLCHSSNEDGWMGGCVSLLQESESFVYMPKNDAAGSYGSFICCVLRNVQTFFQSDCSSLHAQ